MAARDRESGNVLVAEFKFGAGVCYTVEVDMLDLHIYKGRRISVCRKLDYRPHIKSTARHLPLSQFSAHAPSVHKFWPVSEISTMHRLSLHSDDFELYRSIKIARFERFGLDRQVIAACKSWTPRIRSSIAASCIVPRDRNVLRIIVPYHSHIYRGFSRVLSGVQDTWNLLLGGVCPHLQVAVGYRSHGRLLVHMLNRNRECDD